MMPKMKKIDFIIFSILFFVIFSGSVFAGEYATFGGRPAFPRSDNPRSQSIFVHTLKPGDIKEEGVLMVNNTPEAKIIMVYGVDSELSSGGSFACAQFSQTKKDVGAWINLEKSEITLEPHTQEVIPFTINVPQNAEVGEHNGCIVTQEKIDKPDENQSGATFAMRSGLRVVITVPGELQRKLEIAGFGVTPREDGGFLLQPVVKNLGNVSIDSEIKVLTKYFFGLTAAEHGGKFPIMRGETSSWNFEFKKPFWGGWFSSNFIVEYDANPEAGVGVLSGKPLTSLKGTTVWFFSFPTNEALAIEITIFLFILFCIFLVCILFKRKKWIKKNWVTHTVRSGSDLNSLAKHFDVSWKLLAKVNKLEPPYVLKSGQKIKVPPRS